MVSSEDVVDHVVALKGFTHASQCSTLDRVLWGGVGYTNNLPIKLVQRYGVAERTAKHLVETYGARSLEVCEMSEPTGKAWPLHGIPIVEGHPHIECEVKYACMEYTRTVADFLSLRTRLAYVNIVGARAAVPRVTELMAVELGWDDAESTRQLQAAYDHLAEFGGPVPIMEEQRRHGDFKDLFRMFDRDDDGAITLEEMRSAADVLGMPFASDAEAEEARTQSTLRNNSCLITGNSLTDCAFRPSARWDRSSVRQKQFPPRVDLQDISNNSLPVCS